MKKVKIMLAALSVLAIVGGALAFKAQKTFGGTLKCVTVDNFPTTVCPEIRYALTDVNPTISLCKPIGAPDTDPCQSLEVTKHP
jgi:hypothetical protein